jgi:hypothetical protein
MSTIRANYILDAAGGNTATINGAIPAPATSPTLTNPIISGNLGAGGANYGTSGQVLTSGGAGASTSWSTIATGGMTLLGTLATTSGTTVTLSGLDLTSYKQLMVVFKQVSPTAGGTVRLSPGADALAIGASVALSTQMDGIFVTDLATGISVANTYNLNAVGENNSFQTGNPTAGIQRSVTNSSTSISFGLGTGTFDNGSILIYGVK